MTRPTQKARDSEDGNIFNEPHFYTNTVGALLVRKKRKSIFGEKKYAEQPAVFTNGWVGFTQVMMEQKVKKDRSRERSSRRQARKVK